MMAWLEIPELPATGEYHHLAVVSDGVDTRTYVDGELVHQGGKS